MTEPDIPDVSDCRCDVLIIGGGIIGATCAYELAQRGVSVAVIEKGRIGHGCSYGNGGWISPCVALPLAMPGMIWTATKWLVDPESPLYIAPRPSAELLRWLARFINSTRRSVMNQSTAALVELAQHSLEVYKELDAKHPGEFAFTQKGLLAVAQTAEGVDGINEHMELVRAHGVLGRALDKNEVRELEPAITSTSIAGGVYYPNEAHAEPLVTVEAVARYAQKAGARFFTGVEVFDFECRGRMIETLSTTSGRLQAKQVVVASGFWSNRLARRIGLRVPVLPGKGYAVIVEPFEPKLKIPLLLQEPHVGVTPRANSVRLAGTLELVGPDDAKITTRRVDAIVRGARRFLDLREDPKIREVWRGLRPCTPDSVPIIGRSPKFDNLLIATGHQMLGLLSAPATARLLADLLTGDDPPFDPRPFRPERF